jgi:protein O-mannosyl-transferase
MPSSRSRVRSAQRSQSLPAILPPPLSAPTAGWGRREWLLIAALSAGTLLTFSPVFRCGFVNFDDGLYVNGNSMVEAGLTERGIAWAWTTTWAGNWHPLTWLSLMLDSQLFGNQPWGYHLTNLLIHLANTLLLFILFWRATAAVWRSAAVAALFALHPLHVESVAWVSERKDVLSILFGLLALLAYTRYTQTPRMGCYLLVVLGMVLSLLCKPMLVTLPFLLLLLDFWPLCRWQPGTGMAVQEGDTPRRLVSLPWLLLEKLPLLGLSAASCFATMWAQQRGESVAPLGMLPLPARLTNALVSYVQYLRQTLLPLDLSPFYPHPRERLGAGVAAAAGFLVAATTVMVLRWGRRLPYLPVGWLWYVGTLVPVIGLVQVGAQGRADRYTYFPLVGIFLLLVWGLADLARRWRCERSAACFAGVAIVFFMLTTWTQAHCWQDSLHLWEQAFRTSGSSSLIHTNLGRALLERGEVDEAACHFQDALRINPHYAPAHFDLGRIWMERGQPREAVHHFRTVVHLHPEAADAHNSLGIALMRQGEMEEAGRHFEEALRFNPNDDAARFNFGLLFQTLGKWPEAVDCFQQCVSLQPQNARYRRTLAYALQQQGRTEEASAEYRESLRLDPDWPRAALQMAWTRATDPDPVRRHGQRAVQEAEQVRQALGSRDPKVLDILAAAYAECGRFAEAKATAREALTQASASRQTSLASQIEARIRLYEKEQPFHAAQPQ